MPRSRKLIIVLGLVLAIFSAACQPAQPTPTASPSPQPSPTDAPTAAATLPRLPAAVVDPFTRAVVRFLIAVPEAPPLDIYVEGALVAGGLPPSRLTGSLPLAPGSYAVRIVPAGAPLTSPDARFEGTINLEASESVVLMLGGHADALTLSNYAEDLSPVPEGQARLMVINAVQDGALVSVSVDDTLIARLPGGGLPPPPSIITAGQHRVIIERDGVALVSDTFLFRNRENHTLIITSTASGAVSYAVAPSPTRRENRLRFAHASQSLGAVDVYLDDQRIAQNVGPRQYTEWETIISRGYTLSLRTAGAPPTDSPLLMQPLSLNPDQAGTLVLYDGRAAGAAQLAPRTGFFAEDVRPTFPGQARIAVLNAVDAERLQVTSGGQVISGLGAINQGTLSAAIPLDAGEVDLIVNGFSSGSALGGATANTVETTRLTLEPGFSYLYVVTGNVRDRAPLILATEVGATVAANPTATPASVVSIRFINVLDGLGAVDLYVGDTALFQGVQPGQGTPFVAVDPAVRPIGITLAGSPERIARGELIFSPNRHMLITAIGTADDVQLLQTIEPALPVNANALVRAIHAAPGVVPFSVDYPLAGAASSIRRAGTPQPTPTPRLIQYLPPLDYPTISAPVALRPGVYTFNLRSAVDGTVLVQLAELAIERGTRYDVLLLPGIGGPQVSVVVTAGGQ